jgi:hypothetical protein
LGSTKKVLVPELKKNEKDKKGGRIREGFPNLESGVHSLSLSPSFWLNSCIHEYIFHYSVYPNAGVQCIT